ncbi:MAG: AAA family ATPase, partial [Nitrososphaera sp.]|nr:AAA family ATPase [Nitrososphaera sp.]
MIKKVISITRVGKFKDLKAKHDVEFRKLTLIHSENGRGKSTLSTVFRSFQNGDPDSILGRQTLGETSGPEVQIRIDGATATFKNKKWDATLSVLELFDSQFVRENVHAGGEVDHENQKNLYRFALGEQGVKLAQQIEQQDKDIRELTADIKTKGKELEGKCSSGFTLQQFMELKQIDKVQEAIKTKEQEVGVLRQEKEISAKPELSQLELAAFPHDELRAVLGNRPEGISKEVEQFVKDYVEKKLGDDGEAWLGQGVGYAKDDSCPFCGLDTKSSKILGSFKAYFDASYAKFKSNIGELKSKVTESFSENNLLKQQRLLDSNSALSEFWKQYVSGDFPTLDAAELARSWIDARNKVLAAFDQKAASPFDAIEVAGDLL